MLPKQYGGMATLMKRGFKTVEEISSKGRTRILEPASDITNSIEKQKSYTGYVHLPIDLRRVNSPSQYLLIFVTEARYINTDGFLCALIQKTEQVANPPPKITISTEVDSLTIDPIFRTKTIEAKVKSSSDIPFNITLLNSSTRFMEASFNPSIVTLPPSGWVISQFTVNSNSDRTWNYSVTETLPIAANMSGLQKGNYFLFGTQTRHLKARYLSSPNCIMQQMGRYSIIDLLKCSQLQLLHCLFATLLVGSGLGIYDRISEIRPDVHRQPKS